MNLLMVNRKSVHVRVFTRAESHGQLSKNIELPCKRFDDDILQTLCMVQ